MQDENNINESAIIEEDSYVEEPVRKSKKGKVIKIAIIIVVAGLIGFGGYNLFKVLTRDTADYIELGNLNKAWEKAKTDEDRQLVIEAYCKKGKYNTAYKKADDDAKKEIYVESTVARLSLMASETLDDPKDFYLGEAFYLGWYNEDQDEVQNMVVLEVGEKNSVTDLDIKFWLYIGKDDEWKLAARVDEYDGSDAAETCGDIMFSDYATQLDDTAISSINKLFKKGKLGSIDWISVEDLDLETMIMEW